MHPADHKTRRFIAEHNTALTVQAEAKKRGTKLTLEEAHSVWAEYSDRMCAGWMSFDSENPTAEIWREITIWMGLRNRKP